MESLFSEIPLYIKTDFAKISFTSRHVYLFIFLSKITVLSNCLHFVWLSTNFCHFSFNTFLTSPMINGCSSVKELVLAGILSKWFVLPQSWTKILIAWSKLACTNFYYISDHRWPLLTFRKSIFLIFSNSV